MTWTSLSFNDGEILYANSHMNPLYDNLAALAAQDAGAPMIDVSCANIDLLVVQDGAILPNSSVGVTQAMGNNSTLLATTAFVVNADPGMIIGLEPRYASATEVLIPAGLIRANGKECTLTSDYTHAMTTLSGSEYCRYLYVDDSATTAPTAVIVDNLTAPTWDYARNGWYSGDDRYLGAVPTVITSSTIPYFDMLKISERQVRVTIGIRVFPELATAMNPDGTWQTPDDHESSEFLPETANEISLFLYGGDTGAECEVYGASKEHADVQTNVLNAPFTIGAYAKIAQAGWVILGATRNVRIGGQDNDDNALYAYVNGWGYAR